MNALAPLAERMRPKNLEAYIGQEHLLADNAPLTRALEAGIIPSMIFWGPPGVGKTTLAYLVAEKLKKTIHTLSAISSGVKDVREVIAKVQNAGMFQESGTILFIDEIHRFSKSQQDSLLGAVEKGVVTLIGATTENPSFEVISALLSRCHVYTLKDHSKKDLIALLQRAIAQDSVLAQRKVTFKEYDSLLAISGGDARKILNVFEIIISAFPENEVLKSRINWFKTMPNNPWRATTRMEINTTTLYLLSLRPFGVAMLMLLFIGWHEWLKEEKTQSLLLDV